ncbi:MAG: hypothetical protein ACM3Q4_01760 [Acidobacteriota bacterium]
MVTLFAIPKPFIGHTAVIQHNSIESWKKFHPEYQIILFGNEEGIAEAAREHGIEHVPEVRRNELGTPLMNAVFEEADRIARFPTLCYVNSDIMLLSDLNEAVRRVCGKERYLMVGQRWNLDVTERIDFTRPDIDREIRLRTMQHGGLALLWAMDYFVFPRGMWEKLPQFAIGRPGWDNWMLYQSRTKRIDLINSSLVVMAVHQNHPPAYTVDGVEAKQNQQTLESTGMTRPYTLLDATHLLTPFSLQDIALRRPEETVKDIDLMPQFRSILKDIYKGRDLQGDDRFFYNHILAAAHWYDANLGIREKRYISAMMNILSAQRIVPHGYSWKRFFVRAGKEIRRFVSPQR